MVMQICLYATHAYTRTHLQLVQEVLSGQQVLVILAHPKSEMYWEVVGYTMRSTRDNGIWDSFILAFFVFLINKVKKKKSS